MKNLKKQIKKFLADESGQGTVEYILILVGVVALAFLFRDGITTQVRNAMNQLGGRISEFVGS